MAISISSKSESQVSEALRLQHLPKNCFSRISNYFSRIFGFLDPCELGSVERVNSSRQRMIALHVQDLPKDCFSHIFSFLDPRELASVERVNSSWQGMIGSHDQNVWKEQCRIQHVLVDNPIIAHIEQALGLYSSQQTGKNFNSRILSIIISYNGESIFYKKFATVIRGNVYIDDNYDALTVGCKRMPAFYLDRGAVNYKEMLHLRWGSSEDEIFVRTQIYSAESIAACKTHHKKCENNHIQGSWEDIHPWLPDFPNKLPVRFFIKRDGSYKQDGDTIQLCHQNKAIILTCTYKDSHDQKKFTHVPRTFEYGMARRVKSSVSSQWVSSKYVTSAQIAAQTAPDWISSD